MIKPLVWHSIGYVLKSHSLICILKPPILQKQMQITLNLVSVALQ